MENFKMAILEQTDDLKSGSVVDNTGHIDTQWIQTK
jgi:hypothetical protein